MNKKFKIKMRTVLVIMSYILLVCNISAQQQNNFIIGMYGADAYTTVNGVIVTTPKDPNNNYTSWSKIIAEDGFNTTITYRPDFWENFTDLTNLFTLFKNSNLKVIDHSVYFFKPYTNGMAGGENQYDITANPTMNDPAALNIGARYTKVYNNSDLANTILAHTLGSELSCNHDYPLKNIFPSGWCDTCNNSEYKTAQMVPQNLSDALGEFYLRRNALPAVSRNQKIIFGGANHGGRIPGFHKQGNLYDEANYITMDGVTNPQKPDIFYESSYFSTEFGGWMNTRTPEVDYLGKFKSIDYAKTKFNSVLAEIYTEQNYPIAPWLQYAYHTNADRLNANQLWFQTYTSIIHGVDGVEFYSMEGAYRTSSPVDAENEAIYRNASLSYRYNRAYLPQLYIKYIANLAKELAYLVKQDLLSTDRNSILYTKTENADDNCILPNSSTYLLETIQGVDGEDIYKVNNLPVPLSITNVHRTEDYGLRYTIRTNGTGTEVIMIISNPNPYTVKDVPLNFNNLSNPVIKNSTGIKLLFETENPTDSAVSSLTYKTNRNSGIVDPANPATVPLSFTINYAAPSNKTVTLSFGPMDVHIIKFVITPPTNNTDWAKVWSNNGNKTIGAWGLRPSDKYLIGDFDKNGKDDLLALNGIPNFSGNWALLQEYNETSNSWDWKWTNNGNNRLAADWVLDPACKYYVGDFDGDQKSDILCISGNNLMANIYTYLNGNWNRIWTNTNNGIIGSWTIRSTDTFLVGDFDKNGTDNLLMINGIPNFSGNWFLMQEFNKVNGTWSWNAANGGNNLLAPNWILNSTHRYFTGDFNGDDVADVLCVSGTDTRTNIYSYNAGNFQNLWNNTTPPNLNSIAGYTLPFLSTDKILLGNIDDDKRSELLIIQRGTSAAWAQTKELSPTTGALTWMWTNDPPANQPRINDWTLASGNTDYYLMKVSATANKKYLLAISDVGSSANCSNPNYLVSIYKTTLSNYREALSVNSEASISNPLNIYPNPSSGVLNLQYDSQENTVAEVKIYNVTGQCIKELQYINSAGHIEEIELKNVPKGTYILNYKTKDTQLNKLIFLID